MQKCYNGLFHRVTSCFTDPWARTEQLEQQPELEQQRPLGQSSKIAKPKREKYTFLAPETYFCFPSTIVFTNSFFSVVLSPCQSQHDHLPETNGGIAASSDAIGASRTEVWSHQQRPSRDSEPERSSPNTSKHPLLISPRCYCPPCFQRYICEGGGLGHGG